MAVGATPHTRIPARAVASLLLGLSVALAAPLWLPLPGRLLVEDDALATADAALVLEGSGVDALGGAEAWRQAGLVRDVVLVEAPIRTHALVAYWSDFVAWGLASQAATPSDHLRVVVAASTRPADQVAAGAPALAAFGARSVLVPGGGGLGSRAVREALDRQLGPAGVSVRVVHVSTPEHDPGRWYANPDDRRAVLAAWLERVFPFMATG